MTDRLTDSMLDPLTNMFLLEYASKFHEVLNSRDIRKVVRWLERKHREVIVPYARDHPFIAAIFEEPLGMKIGESLGEYIVDKYEAYSPEKKENWNSNRWLHHGAVGELLVIRGRKKSKPFLIGLGKGLMKSDLQDLSDWHTSEYSRAKETLLGMR
ncbi:MAG: hypothetical protein ACFFB7_03030 [Candidatus Sifarchaeia archaeon]